MEVTEIMNNSLRLEIIKKVIFKDYQLALLPYISAAEIDDNDASMKKLPTPVNKVQDTANTSGKPDQDIA